jgi:uncharacterized protein (DUF488 family)
MRLFTIGFTKTSAEHFFSRLIDAGVVTMVDVRLNNVSQLAGFAKREDLKYFLKSLANIEYRHALQLAPTQTLLDAYRKAHGSWSDYEKQFRELLVSRAVETTLRASEFDRACLLCSEDKPDHCHRRIVAEYMQARWADVHIVHL